VKQLGHVLEGCSLAVVILVGFAVFGAIHAFTSFMSGLPWFASEAQKMQVHLQAVQEQQQAALVAPWMRWKVGAESVAWITLCLSFSLFLLLSLVAFGAHRVRASSLVWPKGGVLPVPRHTVLREARPDPEDGIAVTVGERLVRLYWRVEDDQAQKALPPVTQHIHEIKPGDKEAPAEPHNEIYDAYVAEPPKGSDEV
jgi:hypothetical protein